MIEITKDNLLDAASNLMQCGKNGLKLYYRTKVGDFTLFSDGLDKLYFALNLRVNENTTVCDCVCDDKIIYAKNGKETVIHEGIYTNNPNYENQTAYDIIPMYDKEINHFFTHANFQNAIINYIEIRRIC